jgi:hypothetical protein
MFCSRNGTSRHGYMHIWKLLAKYDANLQVYPNTYSHWRCQRRRVLPHSYSALRSKHTVKLRWHSYIIIHFISRCIFCFQLQMWRINLRADGMEIDQTIELLQTPVSCCLIVTHQNMYSQIDPDSGWLDCVHARRRPRDSHSNIAGTDRMACQRTRRPVDNTNRQFSSTRRKSPSILRWIYCQWVQTPYCFWLFIINPFAAAYIYCHQRQMVYSIGVACMCLT